jgi:hypothetical protein
MSTFYLLPPRPHLGERFAGYLRNLFPGLEWSRSTWTELADIIGSAVARHPDVYVVYGEELPVGQDLTQVLADGFGAEAGDEVVEVRSGAKPGEVTTRRWRLGAGSR